MAQDQDAVGLFGRLHRPDDTQGLRARLDPGRRVRLHGLLDHLPGPRALGHDVRRVLPKKAHGSGQQRDPGRCCQMGCDHDDKVPARLQRRGHLCRPFRSGGWHRERAPHAGDGCGAARRRRHGGHHDPFHDLRCLRLLPGLRPAGAVLRGRVLRLGPRLHGSRPGGNQRVGEGSQTPVTPSVVHRGRHDPVHRLGLSGGLRGIHTEGVGCASPSFGCVQQI
mmetsp:Transcript_95032/g.283774  ORF Transcript_95032/g.283774 Transcript_95032/m.283774 type:complete len:222 (+) Transcript_95032:870-1535(+)